MDFSKNVIGTWMLESFEIKTPEGIIKPWGNKTHGLLIYADSGHMSVSINREPENKSGNEAQNSFDSILFYSGTYQVEGNVIRHQVTEASNPSRIGKEMIRYAEIKNNTLILTTPIESFGQATLVWKRT